MKKYIIFSAILTTVIFILSACSNDFLTYQSYGSPANDQFWKTQTDLQSAVDGLYFWTGEEEIDGDGFFWYENASDNMITGRVEANPQTMKNFQDNGTASLGYLDEEYIWMYQLINRSNNILLYAPPMNVSRAVKNEALGESYFFRGFAYLWLAPWYADNTSGGLPIMLPTTPLDSVDMARPASVLTNYDMIIADFKKAAALVSYFQDLPVTQYGRPHKTACWGFIARAALLAAQYNVNSAQYYKICSDYCDSIINSNRHSLVPNYADFFTPAQNYGPEYLWNLPSSQFGGCQTPGIIFENAGWGLYNNWGYFQPTLELYNEYETGDTRRSATIAYPGDVLSYIGTNNITYAVNPVNVSSPSLMACRKYLAPYAGADCVGKTVNTNGNDPTTTLDPPVLRYADILLMKAEAMIWTNQNGDQWLNQVRNRAGLASKSNATKADLKHERRCELAYEWGAFRFTDLVRWGDAATNCTIPLHGLMRRTDGVSIANWKKADGSINTDSASVVWPARIYNSYNDVFAIPYSVTSVSKNLKQNKGY
jgi:hypothetical protein